MTSDTVIFKKCLTIGGVSGHTRTRSHVMIIIFAVIIVVVGHIFAVGTMIVFVRDTIIIMVSGHIFTVDTTIILILNVIIIIIPIKNVRHMIAVMIVCIHLRRFVQGCCLVIITMGPSGGNINADLADFNPLDFITDMKHGTLIGTH